MTWALRTAERWRAAVWSVRAVLRVRRQLRTGGIDTVQIERVPPARGDAPPGLRHTKHLLRSTCLERALVHQRWLLAQGTPVDVVIGVRSPAGDVEAHAWIDGELESTHAGFVEIARHLPPVVMPEA